MSWKAFLACAPRALVPPGILAIWRGAKLEPEKQKGRGGSEPPVDRDRLRFDVAVTASLGAFAMFALWASGWLPGYQGFAYAQDVEKKIAERLEPIQAQLAKVTTMSEQTQADVRWISGKILEAQLRDKIRRHCRETDPRDRDALASEIEDDIIEYETRSGKRFRRPKCEDL